jgi:hypothetical protein
MLKYLRKKRGEIETGPDPIELTRRKLEMEPDLPITLRSINDLHHNLKQRIYRTLIPQRFLFQFDVHPISWRGPDKETYVTMKAEPGWGKVYLEARSPFDPDDPFFLLEIEDSRFNRIDLNLVVLNDPTSERFYTDIDSEGRQTLFGTVRRNLAAEEKAMAAGLAPGQVRQGVRGLAEVLNQLETFMIALGHQSIGLEPLTYVSAWIFERRGFAYTQGHHLLDRIHQEFQPGGKLHAALDGSSPFRRPEQWETVRGRAWAIHDGVLEAIDQQWDQIRMIKQIGRNANVNTFPDARY